MKRVLTAVVLIPIVLLVLFRAPLWLFTLVVGAVAMGAAWEYLKLVDAYGVKSMKTMLMIVSAVVFVLMALANTSGDWAFPATLGICVAVASSPFLLLIGAMETETLAQGLPRAAMSFMVIPYVILTMLCLATLRHAISGLFLILFTFAVVWSGDICAYYAGRAFGKNKLAPRISPGKTWEGTIASFVGSVFLAHIFFVDNRQIMEALYRWHLASSPAGLPEMNRHLLLVQGVATGGCVNVAAQFGDLVESMLKRGAGVKDSGDILPGHGGILDRIDALLFALPIVTLYYILVRTMY